MTATSRRRLVIVEVTSLGPIRTVPRSAASRPVMQRACCQRSIHIVDIQPGWQNRGALFSGRRPSVGVERGGGEGERSDFNVSGQFFCGPFLNRLNASTQTKAIK